MGNDLKPRKWKRTSIIPLTEQATYHGEMNNIMTRASFQIGVHIPNNYQWLISLLDLIDSSQPGMPVDLTVTLNLLLCIFLWLTL